MKLSIKELGIIAVFTVISFPIMYLGVLIGTGNARLEFMTAEEKAKEVNKKELAYINYTSKKDSLSAVQSHSFMAALNARQELEAERSKMQGDIGRIDMLKQELETAKNELTALRKAMEKLVVQNDSLEQMRVKQLAKVYASMRAPEAARILETLDDKLVVSIMNAISDDRQKAKIFSSFSNEKASVISSRMGR